MMTIHLTPGSIGLKATQLETAEWAHDYGFEAVEPNPDELSRMSDSEIRKLKEFMQARNLVFGCAGLRTEFRGEEEMFQQGMKTLPEHAKALQRVGVTRVGTWLRPMHDQLTFRKNFEQHARRLGAIAGILDSHGIRLGLEYVAPKTLWSRGRFPFVHTMAESKELIAEIGKKNVGFVLDSWHWYTASETPADILTLKNADVVSCDLNDAPAGIPVDQQIDSARELPCATGVIDVAGFLNSLAKIGYDGPVRAEPFNAELRKRPPDEILALTAEAMRTAFAKISG